MTPQPSVSEVRKVIFLLPVWQLLTGVAIAFIFFLLNGTTAAMASFFGACISSTGSLVFAIIVFGLRNVPAENIMRNMFRAEAFKILTVVLMFYVSISVLALPFLPVMIGFIATLIVFIVALVLVFR